MIKNYLFKTKKRKFLWHIIIYNIHTHGVFHTELRYTHCAKPILTHHR